MFGQRDADSGQPTQGATAWATASPSMKQEFHRLCDTSHTHQILLGSNSKGRRAALKAEYPQEVATAIVVGIGEHVADATAWHAFPAELRDEEAQ